MNAIETLQEMIRETKKPMVDPFKVDAFYMKQVPKGWDTPSAVVKITNTAALECYGGGSMEVHTASKLDNLSYFMKQDFIPATKEEFDTVNIKAAREINAVNAIV